ncbi:MAG: dTMP kinase [Elusimicrobiales bacterium]
MKKGLFIVLEGPDRTGKSTQSGPLVEYLRGLGRNVVLTREPGGTKLAEAVRSVILNPRQRICPLAELLLYEASRAQHVQEKILPALKAGCIVISERFTMSTAAYQGYGRGLDLKTIDRLNKIATAGLEPDLTVVLDMPESFFGKRRRREAPDRLERENAKFRARVRRGYRELARKTRRAVLADAALPPDEVQSAIRRAVDKLLCR